MAGEVLLILLRYDIQAEWERLARTLGTVVECEHYTELNVRDTTLINGSYKGPSRPFLYTVAPPEWHYYENNVEVTKNLVQTHFGWVPAQRINLSAMCKGMIDNLIIREILLYLMEHFDGFVDPGMPVDAAILQASSGFAVAVPDREQTIITSFVDRPFVFEEYQGLLEGYTAAQAQRSKPRWSLFKRRKL